MAGKFFLALSLIAVCEGANSLKIKQVLVISRHNLRTPLSQNLEMMSSKIWPKWSEKVGYLTERGGLLEGYMGNYFSQWLRAEGLFPNGCPDEKSVHIYANTKQRTKESAKAFVKTAFEHCNVTVHYKNTKEMDPTFNPVIHNTTDAFKEEFFAAMKQKMNETNLKDSYLELNRIINIKESKICEQENYCDLANDKDDVLYQIGVEPNTTAPLYIGTSIVDSFIMSYYQDGGVSK